VISWLITLALPYLVKAALAKLGVSASVAAILAPRVISVLKEAADIAKLAKAKGATDEKAVEAADKIILSGPLKKVALDDILRSENQPNV
jgi:hypothetical protein